MIDRANDHYALDITRARTLLEWEPKRSLRETLPKIVAGMKADPVAWYRENDLELSSELEKAAGKSDAPAAALPPQERPAVSPSEHVHESRDSPGPASPEPTSHAGHAAAMATGAAMKARDAKATTPGNAKMDAQSPSWPHFANMTVGLWLITSAFAMAYGSAALQGSDIASGTLVILLAVLSLSRRPFLKLCRIRRMR